MSSKASNIFMKNSTLAMETSFIKIFLYLSLEKSDKYQEIPVAEFSSSARHVGGADLSGKIPWSQLVPPTLLVDGRIDIQLASNYLCGLRFSTSTDVTVLSMNAPDSPAERAQFDKLFNYFVDLILYQYSKEEGSGNWTT
ncbi:hypothetical protein VTN77DRAFT_6860 [Rasamsonia byssochlamydoides]|uniref:uncharacterized protein n=1 Tax=Rasamsonia byssochlamydoides TaxID=89139 RepID=UPI00374318BB